MMKKLVDAEILNETDKAFFITGPLLEVGSYKAWFPKSAIGVETLKDGTVGDIFAEVWIIEKKEEEIEDCIFTSEVG